MCFHERTPKRIAIPHLLQMVDRPYAREYLRFPTKKNAISTMASLRELDEASYIVSIPASKDSTSSIIRSVFAMR